MVGEEGSGEMKMPASGDAGFEEILQYVKVVSRVFPGPCLDAQMGAVRISLLPCSGRRYLVTVRRVCEDIPRCARHCVRPRSRGPSGQISERNNIFMDSDAR